MGQHYIYSGKVSGNIHVVSFKKLRTTSNGNPATKVKAYVDGWYVGTSDSLYGDIHESALKSWLSRQKEEFEIDGSYKNYTTALNQANNKRCRQKSSQRNSQ